MKQFEVKKNGHEWLVTHNETGISQFIPSSETQPKAVLLELADDFVYWNEYAKNGQAQTIQDHKMRVTAEFMLDIDFTVEDATRLQFELATEACGDPHKFYGGED